MLDVTLANGPSNTGGGPESIRPRRRSFVAIIEADDRRDGLAAIVGWGYTAIGDHDKTFFWLNRGLAAREPALRDNRVKYSDVRDDPRFAELTNRLARGFDD
jgi:hypothetical protein